MLRRTPRGPLHCAYGEDVSASCVLYVPEAQGSLPLGPTHEVRARYAYQPRANRARGTNQAGSHAGVLAEQRCYEIASALPLPWCMQNLCEEGSVGPVLCPAGFHCPDVTRKVC